MTIFDTVSEMMTQTEAVLDAFIALRDSLTEDEWDALNESNPHLECLLDYLADLESAAE